MEIADSELGKGKSKRSLEYLVFKIVRKYKKKMRDRECSSSGLSLGKLRTV